MKMIDNRHNKRVIILRCIFILYCTLAIVDLQDSQVIQDVRYFQDFPIAQSSQNFEHFNIQDFQDRDTQESSKFSRISGFGQYSHRFETFVIYPK